VEEVSESPPGTLSKSLRMESVPFRIELKLIEWNYGGALHYRQENSLRGSFRRKVEFFYL